MAPTGQGNGKGTCVTPWPGPPQVVQKLTQMVGKNVKLYDMVLQFLRTLFLRTRNVHYCTLRAELLMSLHDLDVGDICSVDPCHKVAPPACPRPPALPMDVVVLVPGCPPTLVTWDALAPPPLSAWVGPGSGSSTAIPAHLPLSHSLRPSLPGPTAAPGSSNLLGFPGHCPEPLGCSWRAFCTALGPSMDVVPLSPRLLGAVRCHAETSRCTSQWGLPERPLLGQDIDPTSPTPPDGLGLAVGPVCHPAPGTKPGLGNGTRWS